MPTKQETALFLHEQIATELLCELSKRIPADVTTIDIKVQYQIVERYISQSSKDAKIPMRYFRVSFSDPLQAKLWSNMLLHQYGVGTKVHSEALTSSTPKPTVRSDTNYFIDLSKSDLVRMTQYLGMDLLTLMDDHNLSFSPPAFSSPTFPCFLMDTPEQQQDKAKQEEVLAFIKGGKGVFKMFKQETGKLVPSKEGSLPPSDISFLMQQLIDPEHHRPSRSERLFSRAIAAGATHYYKQNRKTGEWTEKTFGTAKKEKPGTTHSKKTATSLSPKETESGDFYVPNGQGYIWNYNDCDPRDEKYFWKGTGTTDYRPDWLSTRVILGDTQGRAISLSDVFDFNLELVRDQKRANTELLLGLPKIEKLGGQFTSGNTLGCRLNLICYMLFTKEQSKLPDFQPLFVIAPDMKTRSYDADEQVLDLIRWCTKSNGDSFLTRVNDEEIRTFFRSNDQKYFRELMQYLIPRMTQPSLLEKLRNVCFDEFKPTMDECFPALEARTTKSAIYEPKESEVSAEDILEEDVYNARQFLYDPKFIAAKKATFDTFLGALQRKADELVEKGTKGNKAYDKHYETVATAATELIQSLGQAGQNFFDAPHPNADILNTFVEECGAAIKKATDEFRQVRSAWSHINPVVKKLLGVLSAVSVAPALIVEKKSPKGFVQTFFGRSSADAEKKLQLFNEALQAIIQDIKSLGP